MVDEQDESGKIRSILRYRTARFRKYNFKSMATMDKDCISYMLMFNTKQMRSLPNKLGSKKVERWKANEEFYMYWYVQNSTLSFSRLLARRWDKLIAAGVTVEEVEDADTETESEDNICLASQILYDKFEALFQENNISPEKERCFWDRFTGMAYSEMMRLYEPDSLAKDPKGQKYQRRFDRLLIELGIPKEQIQIYLDEMKIKRKKEKKDKLT